MLPSYQIALSGLQAASLRLEAAAGNIANAGSVSSQPSNAAAGPAAPAPYQPVAVDTSTLPGGGVAATLRKVSPGFETAISGQASGPAVDLATEVTNMQMAKFDFMANAQVLKATDEMVKRLFEMMDDHAS